MCSRAHMLEFVKGEDHPAEEACGWGKRSVERGCCLPPTVRPAVDPSAARWRNNGAVQHGAGVTDALGVDGCGHDWADDTTKGPRGSARGPSSSIDGGDAWPRSTTGLARLCSGAAGASSARRVRRCVGTSCTRGRGAGGQRSDVTSVSGQAAFRKLHEGGVSAVA
jgi:hypothetical protein